jgi:hypothetical protein
LVRRAHFGRIDEVKRIFSSAADGPKFKSRNRSEITTEEVAAQAKGTIAHYGTWSVNETLLRRADGDLIPNTEWTEAKVTVALSGDELALTGSPSPVSGGGTNVVDYRRAK